MVYMLMIYSDESWVNQTPEQMRRVMEGHQALDDELRGKGKFHGGAGLALARDATTVRFRDNKPVVTDGPFAETKECFGGFYLIEAENLDEALAVAKRIPGIPNRSIEVRPVMHHSPP
jgi:hypothetical protein